MIGYLKKAREEQSRKTEWEYSENGLGFVEKVIKQDFNVLEMKLNEKTGVYELKNG